MPTAALSRHPAFTFYVDGLSAAEKSMAFWNDMFRTSSSFAWWWTRTWLDTPKAFMTVAAASPRLARKAAQAGAAVIDLAEAAAERAASAAAQMEAVMAEEVAVVVEELVDSSAAMVDAVAEELKPDPDDLTLLVGIGPKLAAALAERGVTRFAHIAAWGEDELISFDKDLDLKGRAVRDAWVAQAKRLTAG